MAQPLPSHSPQYEEQTPRAPVAVGAARPFEPWDPAMAAGDNPVAALQSMIYERFDALNRQMDVPMMPPGDGDRLEKFVATVSRVGGVVLFFAALAGTVAAIL